MLLYRKPNSQHTFSCHSHVMLSTHYVSRSSFIDLPRRYLVFATHILCKVSASLNIHCLAPLNPRVKLIIPGVAICFQKVILNGVKSAPHCLTRNLIPGDHQRGTIYEEEINLAALWCRYNFWLVLGKAQSDLIGPHLNLISALMMLVKRGQDQTPCRRRRDLQNISVCISIMQRMFKTFVLACYVSLKFIIRRKHLLAIKL